jgi:virulence factor Mce-like protein
MSDEKTTKWKGASAKRRTLRREDPRRNAIVGVIAVVVAALGFYVALSKHLPFDSPGGRMVTAYFTEPNQIQPGNTPVRVDGVQVGIVASVTPEHGGRFGKVVMRMTNSDFPLHSDASAKLQFRTLLGANFVVNLDPGSNSAPLLGSRAIRNTQVQVEFDDILKTFNANTSAATQTVLRQLANSMSGPQLRTLVVDLAPSLKHTAQAFNDLRGEDSNDLSTLVSSAAQTVKTLSDDRSDLETLISGGSASVGAISDERASLADAVNEAPGALHSTVEVSQSIEATLPKLNALLTALGPGARALGPAAEATKPTVIKLRTTLDRIQPLLSELKPAITQLSAAAAPGESVLTALHPALNRLNSNILPWLNSDDNQLKRPVYQLIGPAFAGLDSVASEYDSASHVIHFPAQPELNSVDAIPCTISVTDLSASECSDLNTVVDNLFGALGSTSSTKSSDAKGSDSGAGRNK